MFKELTMKIISHRFRWNILTRCEKSKGILLGVNYFVSSPISLGILINIPFSDKLFRCFLWEHMTGKWRSVLISIVSLRSYLFYFCISVCSYSSLYQRALSSFDSLINHSLKIFSINLQTTFNSLYFNRCMCPLL